MGLWVFNVPLILVSTLGLLLNGYILLVVLGLSKQVNNNDQIFITLVKFFLILFYFSIFVYFLFSCL